MKNLEAAMSKLQAEAITVTHANFDDILGKVSSGELIMYVPTYLRTTIIRKKDLEKWEAVGQELIRKDRDGKGFRLRRGKHTEYILPDQLRARPDEGF